MAGIAQLVEHYHVYCCLAGKLTAILSQNEDPPVRIRLPAAYGECSSADRVPR